MTETTGTTGTRSQPPQPAISAYRRVSATGAQRCYVRFAALGERGWPQVLAGMLAAAHDVSWCDASATRATAYDVRRVGLREAVAHRPHVVALDAGLADLRRRDWDLEEVRAHLTHCADLLTRRGALLLTTGVGRRGFRHRSRAAQLDAVYAGLAARFGTLHLERAPSAAETASGFAEALRGRGLDVTTGR